MRKLKTLRRQLLLQYLVTVGLLLAGGEVLLYAVSRWAGQRELDTALQKDIERLASAVELERDGDPEIEGEHDFDKVQIYGRTSDWQVIMENGSTLGRSRRRANRKRDLPAVGDDNVPIQKLQIANASYSPWGVVRAARLVTVRRLSVRGNRAAGESRQMRLLLETSELTAADLETTVNEVIAQLPGRERVTVTCAAPKDLKIHGDGLLLAIAVRNLVENSLLYARDGRVWTTFAQSDSGGLEIRVEDEGPGLQCISILTLRRRLVS